MKKPRVLEIGSISTGTLRAEDLLEAYLSALEPLRLTRGERAAVRQIDATIADAERDETGSKAEGYYDNEDATYDLEALAEILDAHAPPYCYFGAHEGDGADLGCWPSWCQIEDDQRDGTITRVTALPTIGQARRMGWSFALLISDHGNAELYRRAGTRWLSVWAVV